MGVPELSSHWVHRLVWFPSTLVNSLYWGRPGNIMSLLRCVLIILTITGIYSNSEEPNDGLVAYDATPEEFYNGGFGSLAQLRSLSTSSMIHKRGRKWYQMKRWPVCTRYSKSCNISPHSCCPGTACRCNIWGQNCRCQRAGLLAQWLG